MAITFDVHNFDQVYRDDETSPVVRVEHYVDLGGNERLDAAGIDADGNIVVTLEVGWINHDWLGTNPSDFDEMTDCEPDEAIWIVLTKSDGHRLFEALGEPSEATLGVQDLC